MVLLGVARCFVAETWMVNPGGSLTPN